jgi:hypothetical protein
MKRILTGTAIILLLGGAAARLAVRWREERADRRLVLLVDWLEVRDEAARLGMADDLFLQRLAASGSNALLVGSSSVEDFLRKGGSFSGHPAAERSTRYLADRSIVSSLRDWESIKDAEAGYDLELVDKARQAGFHIVFRINHDPWLPKDKLFQELREAIDGGGESGFLLNTDEVPGGPEALPEWRALVDGGSSLHLLFEFHPTKATLKLAHAAPAATWRAHTVAANELRDLTPEQLKARWRRAVEERSCRFLLVHVSPNDSLPAYLDGLSALRQDLVKRGWTIAWPRPRMTWMPPSFAQRRLAPVAALSVAILAPVAALVFGLRKKCWIAFAQILAITIGGSCLAAAIADSPLTRVEIEPFRGIKLAFLLAWLGCLFCLYTWDELKDQLLKSVRRIDILAGLAAAATIGYIFMRMGNAGTSWKLAWEQALRDRLEDLLVARPRFKEFAVGYPLLILGLEEWSQTKSKSFWLDGRFLIAIGMVGPISVVNTFCHLHSPLYLAVWRTANGLVLGSVIGLVLLTINERRGKLL